MKHKSIVLIIALVLVIFALIKVIVSQLCAPTPGNVIVETVSSTISSTASVVDTAKPDPLSWEPMARQLLVFFSKNCSR